MHLPAGFSRSLLLVVAFGLLLVAIFHTHIFDSDTLMLNSDQLNGLGSRYLRVESFILTQWDDSRLGGIPTLDALFGDAYHPLVLLQFITDPARAVGFKFIFCVWIAFISAYLLFKKVSGHWEWGALLGFLYALNPQFFTHIYGGHDGKMMVFSVAPIVLLGLIQVIRDGRWEGIIWITSGITWMLLSSHLQLTYLFLWGAGLYTLFEVINLPSNNRMRAVRMGLAALGLVFALMIGSFQIIPPYLYTTQQSVRGTAEKTSIGHAVSWSLHAEELSSMLLPGFLQTDVQRERQYWGHNSFKLNHDSAGMALTFMAFLALLVKKNRRWALFWLTGSTLALSYALGHNSPLFRIWYELIPGIKNFRAPSMAIFWVPLAMGMMAAPMMESFRDPETRKDLLRGAILFLAIGAVASIARFFWDAFIGPFGALVIIALGILLTGFWNTQDRGVAFSVQEAFSSLSSRWRGSNRAEIAFLWFPFLFIAAVFWRGADIASDPQVGSYFQPLNITLMNQSAPAVIPSLVLLALTCAGTLWILFSPRPRPTSALLIGIVSAMDLFVVNHIYIQSVPRKDYWQPEHPAIQAIRADSPDPLQRPRVLSLTRHPAFSGNMFAAYGMRHALGFHDNELASFRAFRGGQTNENLFSDNNFQNNPFINLLNIGYILFDSPQGIRPMRNPFAMGIATLYHHWDTASAQTALALLKNGHDYRRIALISPDIPMAPKLPDSSSAPEEGSVRLVRSLHMDMQEYEVQSNAPAVLVISGNYHPYWKASINGKPAPVFSAFGTLRAVAVPAGQSHVLLTYRSDALARSARISATGLALFILFVLWNARKRLRT